ncbi:MAG: galactokinase family protein, partial [Synergistaceae bacterium]|nr:galactokinase family protein [Synergistaceae bacterium]
MDIKKIPGGPNFDMAACFHELYGGEKPEAFFAPGRVNLIGEHT